MWSLLLTENVVFIWICLSHTINPSFKYTSSFFSKEVVGTFWKLSKKPGVNLFYLFQKFVPCYFGIIVMNTQLGHGFQLSSCSFKGTLNKLKQIPLISESGLFDRYVYSCLCSGTISSAGPSSWWFQYCTSIIVPGI